MNNRAHTPFQTLLSNYLNNQIDDIHWNRFQAVCDLPYIFSSERLAFATYFVDSMENDESLYLPKACEAECLLDEIRTDTFGMAVGF